MDRASRPMKKTVYKAMPRDERYRKKWSSDRTNQALQRKFKALTEAEAVTGKQIRALDGEMARNKQRNIQAGLTDPGYRKWLDKHYEKMREELEAKLLELYRIEPTISIAEGTKEKIAIIRISEDTDTIREEERNLWIEFFKEAGFKPEPVFLPEYLVGLRPSGEAIRIAAAMLGARAVLIYATSTDTDMSWMKESIATLAIARCMLIDTKTEYLYLNAEGDAKKKRVRLPGMIDRAGFEGEVIIEALEIMRKEILHELKRIREEK